MQLREAAEQYADMLTLGAQALKRLADQGNQAAVEVRAVLDDVLKDADRLRTAAAQLNGDKI